jgi:glycosyltransferase involved in cell wall biosynthesis
LTPKKNNLINNSQVRLLLNGLHSKSGGGLNYLKNILPLIAADKDIDLHLCIHKNQRNLLPQNLRNINIHSLEFTPGFWRLQIHEQIDVPRLAKKISADVIFSPANYGPLLVSNSVILLRNALSVAFVERRLGKLGYWALVYFATFLSLLFSKKAIVVSNYARTAFSRSFFSLFKNRLIVVNHGVSKIFSPPKPGIDRDNFLLAVSDIYVQKNLENLIKAFKKLKFDHPYLTLKIAGYPVDFDYFQNLKKVISDNELDNDIQFLGSVKSIELVKLYQSCSIFVFPSTVETFGNPLVEAMACGAPIACSNTTAMPEIAGNAAIFFDPTSVNSITEEISSLLKDEEQRQNLSKLALTRAKSFSWDNTGKNTLAVIKGITGSR